MVCSWSDNRCQAALVMAQDALLRLQDGLDAAAGPTVAPAGGGLASHVGPAALPLRPRPERIFRSPRRL
eukprot:2622486-Pyramimonas_sp.AAC.1